MVLTEVSGVEWCSHVNEKALFCGLRGESSSTTSGADPVEFEILDDSGVGHTTYRRPSCSLSRWWRGYGAWISPPQGWLC